jgi:hypothetical protein
VHIVISISVKFFKSYHVLNWFESDL